MTSISSLSIKASNAFPVSLLGSLPPKKTNIFLILPFLLCIFSLAQFTQYNDEKGHSGKIDIFQNRSGAISLTTSENRSDSLYIGFAKTGNYVFERELSAGHLVKPVETIRDHGKLRLRDEDGYII